MKAWKLKALHDERTRRQWERLERKLEALRDAATGIERLRLTNDLGCARMKRTCLGFCLLVAIAATCHAQERPTWLVEDETLREAINDPWTLWYDKTSMRPTMQSALNSGPCQTYPATYRFNRSDRTSNPNSEFPWRDGGGLLRTHDAMTQRFFWHPEHKPIIYFQETVRVRDYHGQKGRISWMFPAGSVVGGSIGMKSTNHVFEVRLLIREPDDWGQEVHRQWWTARELRDFASANGFESDAAALANCQTVTRAIRDRDHPRAEFADTFELTKIPRLTEEFAAAARRAPLRYEIGYGITSDHSQIVPAGYLGAMVGESRETCVQCHGDVAKHANEIGPQWRDWYGFIRGSDRIFSFHPFDGRFGRTASEAINQGLVRRGIIEAYDPAKHTGKWYRRIAR